MGERDLVTLLQRLDDPSNPEFPPGFEWASSTKRFVETVRQIEGRLGHKIEIVTGDQIQDAAFHAQFIIPAVYIKLPLSAGEQVVVRASNFDRLAAVSKSGVDQEVLLVIQERLSSNGYLYIPTDVVFSRYTGVCAFLAEGATWWDRFFEFL